LSKEKSEKVKICNQMKKTPDTLSIINYHPISIMECGTRDIEGFFHENHDSLLRFLSPKLGSRQEAMDIAQEAYVKILGVEDRAVIRHLKAYLFRTANNLAMNRIKQRTRRQEQFTVDIQEYDLKEDKAIADQILVDRERLRQLEKIISELPPKCRMAFVLYRIECESYFNIAKRMNISESMVRKYVLQGLRYCKDKMKIVEHV
jgi:RNA polymerase sigma-70 factor (ECF subfamily)